MAQRRRHVLLVSNSTHERALVKRLLRSDTEYHWQVADAASVDAALRRCRQQSFDCLIVDSHQIPDQRHDILEPFRREQGAPGLPIVVLNEAEAAVAGDGAQDQPLEYLPKRELSAGALRRAIRFAIEKSAWLGQLDAKREQLTTRAAQTQDALHASNERLRVLFEHAPIGAMLIDLQTLEIADCNNLAAAQLGYTVEELRRLRVVDIEAAEPERVLALVQTLPEGEQTQYETQHRTRQGHVRDVSITAQVLALDGRRLAYCVVRDVTERKRMEATLRASETRFRLLAETNLVGVVYGDEIGNLLYANDAYLSIVGYDRADYQSGQIRWTDLTPPEWLYTDERAIAEARQHGTSSLYEKEYLHKDGRRIPVLLATACVELDQQEQFVAFVIDLTERKQMEEELRRRERELKTLVQDVPDIIARFDRDLRHVYVSPAVERATGLPPIVFLGKTNRDVGMPAELCDLWEDALRDVFERGQSTEIEFSTPTLDGLRHYESRLVPEVGKDGHVATIMAIARDVTERWQAEQARRFLGDVSAALATSLDFDTTIATIASFAVPMLAPVCTIHAFDPEGRLRPVGIACADPAREAIMRTLLDRYLPDDASQQEPFATVLRTSTPVLLPDIAPGAYEAVAVDREHLALLQALGTSSMMIVPLVVRGRAIGFINFGAFTGVRRFEQADLKLAEEFALRVAVALDNARLFAGEQRARTTVEEALKLRDVFLSVAAHELRTPITVLHGTLGLMKRRLERGIALSERDHRSIYTLLNQTRRLDRLIAALLDISRIQTGQLTLERSQIDLCALVRRVVDEVQPALEQHTIECDVLDEATLIEGDALRLEQVIQNLINNAIKYSPHGGPISVRVTRQMEQVCLSVSDQGIGIPPSAQDRLFERFYRAANVDSNKFGGLGIGLYVVKEITTLHGGTVSVQSVEGVGSTFTVCFPAAQPTPALTPS